MVLIKVLLVTSDLSFMVSKKVKMNHIFTVPYLGADTGVSSQLDPALLSQHAGHSSPGSGGQSVDIPPDARLVPFLFNSRSSGPPLGRQLLSRMCSIQNLQILPLDEPGQEKHSDGEESKEKERKYHLDVGPGIETKEAETDQLNHLNIRL